MKLKLIIATLMLAASMLAQTGTPAAAPKQCSGPNCAQCCKGKCADCCKGGDCAACGKNQAAAKQSKCACCSGKCDRHEHAAKKNG